MAITEEFDSRSGAGHDVLTPVLGLVVDDQPVFRAAARDLMAATAGISARGRGRQRAGGAPGDSATGPDLVLLDFGLPGMNGVEVARRAVQSRRSTKIVPISDDPRTSRERCGTGLRRDAPPPRIRSHPA